VAESRGLSLNSVHYNACISACKKHKRYDESLKLFDRMVVARVQPDARTFSAIIQVLGLSGNWGKAQVLFESVAMKDRDAIMYTNLLSAYEKCGKTDLCYNLWLEMKRENLAFCSSQALNSVYFDLLFFICS